MPSKKSQIITVPDAVAQPVGLVQQDASRPPGILPARGSSTTVGSSTSEMSRTSEQDSPLFGQPWHMVDDDGKKEGHVTLVSLALCETDAVASELAMLSLNKKEASARDKLGLSKKQAPHRDKRGLEVLEWPMVRCDSPGCNEVDTWKNDLQKRDGVRPRDL